MAKRPAKSGATSGSFAALREARETVVPAPPLPAVQAPLALSEVLGQERAVRVLEDAVASTKIHHAWIFQGPFGVGKFTMALAFAAMLLDGALETGLSGQPTLDPSSRVQQLLRAGTHPDLRVITKELSRHHPDPEVRKQKQREISVHVVRHFMLEPGGIGAQLPGGLARKVFIIDEAELLNHNAQNALLKFLEEPPAGTVLLLACNAPEELLMTIRSRCQRVSLGPLPEPAMRAWLERSTMALDPAQRDWLVGFAAGSPGALTLCAQTGIGQWWQRLEPMLRQVISGRYVSALGPTMAECVESWSKAWVEAHDNASKEAANHAGAAWMLRVIAWALRRIVTHHAGKDAAPSRAQMDGALRAIDLLRDAERQLDANVNPLFVMDSLASGIAACFARE